MNTMQTTFELNASELDERFITALRTLFKDRNLKITVEAEADDELSRSLAETEGYTFTAAEFERLAADLEAGRKIETSGLKKVAIG
ncbi:MAG: hypothetical protein IAF08_01480 [Rhizobacter sp.]|nr:hypothetical protein [Chlorobiales bacterium]